MRIDGFQNIPSILESFKADKTSSANPGNEVANEVSSVTLSSFAEILKATQRRTAVEAQARNLRVEQLSNQVQSGNFKMDPMKLAERLLNSRIIDI